MLKRFVELAYPEGWQPTLMNEAELIQHIQKSCKVYKEKLGCTPKLIKAFCRTFLKARECQKEESVITKFSELVKKYLNEKIDNHNLDTLAEMLKRFVELAQPEGWQQTFKNEAKLIQHIQEHSKHYKEKLGCIPKVIETFCRTFLKARECQKEVSSITDFSELVKKYLDKKVDNHNFAGAGERLPPQSQAPPQARPASVGPGRPPLRTSPVPATGPAAPPPPSSAAAPGRPIPLSDPGRIPPNSYPRPQPYAEGAPPPPPPGGRMYRGPPPSTSGCPPYPPGGPYPPPPHQPMAPPSSGGTYRPPPPPQGGSIRTPGPPPPSGYPTAAAGERPPAPSQTHNTSSQQPPPPSSGGHPAPTVRKSCC